MKQIWALDTFSADVFCPAKKVLHRGKAVKKVRQYFSGCGLLLNNSRSWKTYLSTLVLSVQISSYIPLHGLDPAAGGVASALQTFFYAEF